MRKDLTGKKFGRLTVLKYHATISRQAMWECKCDCGKTKIVRGSHLTSGSIQSCGCLRIESVRKAKLVHGDTGGKKTARLYGVWCNMKNRCYNKKVRSYKDYGARGIRICDDWKENYSSFKKWAFDNGYDCNAEYQQCTIDRIDNDGNYEPNNCKFSTSKEQCKNRRLPRALSIKQYTVDGNFVKSYDGCRQASEILDKNKSTISAACRGHRKTAYGYVWRYES